MERGGVRIFLCRPPVSLAQVTIVPPLPSPRPSRAIMRRRWLYFACSVLPSAAFQPPPRPIGGRVIATPGRNDVVHVPVEAKKRPDVLPNLSQVDVSPAFDGSWAHEADCVVSLSSNGSVVRGMWVPRL